MTSGLVRKRRQILQKVVVLQRKVRLIAAHNPEVVGSSPASATIKPPNSTELGGFLMQKVGKMRMAVPLSNIFLTFAYFYCKKRNTGTILYMFRCSKMLTLEIFYNIIFT